MSRPTSYFRYKTNELVWQFSVDRWRFDRGDSEYIQVGFFLRRKEGNKTFIRISDVDFGVVGQTGKHDNVYGVELNAQCYRSRDLPEMVKLINKLEKDDSIFYHGFDVDFLSLCEKVTKVTKVNEVVLMGPPNGNILEFLPFDIARNVIEQRINDLPTILKKEPTIAL